MAPNAVLIKPVRYLNLDDVVVEVPAETHVRIDPCDFVATHDGHTFQLEADEFKLLN